MKTRGEDRVMEKDVDSSNALGWVGVKKAMQQAVVCLVSTEARKSVEAASGQRPLAPAPG